ncbi:MAG: hypothetical protein Kow0073_07370 [Immundisolibacter sp.]
MSRGRRLDRSAARMLARFDDTRCRRWREPDEGIWEVRGTRRHRTYSKAMCSVALDRLLRLHEAGHLRMRAGRLRAAPGGRPGPCGRHPHRRYTRRPMQHDRSR